MAFRLDTNNPLGSSSANPYIGAADTGGLSILSQNGINIQGGAITASGGGTQDLENSTVYFGKRERATDKELKLAGVTGAQEAGESYLTYQDALALPLTWSRSDSKKLKELVNKGIISKIAGFDTDMGMPEIMDAWKRLVDASVEFNQNSNTKWTPWDIMDSYGNTKGAFGTERRGDWVYDIATDKPVKYVGPTSKTKTATRVNLTSPEDVRALAIGAMREALGRAPTDQEVAQFAASINSMERSSPEVSTTTVQLKPNLQTGEVEEVASDTTTSGGVSQAAMEGVISQSAQETPEAAKYQGGTTYFNALLGMMG